MILCFIVERFTEMVVLGGWNDAELCKIQADSNEKQTDYYFFSRKDKKYPTGNRANRATTKGFWKATGRDKPIHTKLQTVIGMRKTLVFYQGRAPHGVKTDWIMHEFRLDDGPGHPAHVSYVKAHHFYTHPHLILRATLGQVQSRAWTKKLGQQGEEKKRID